MKLRSKEEQKRRFMMVMPLLVIPFLTMAFAALGGGSKSATAVMTAEKKGLNIEMPSARLSDKPMDKLSYYNAAQADSVKKSEVLKHDPYYQSPIGAGQEDQGTFKFNGNTGFGAQPFATGQLSGPDATEAKVYERLNALNAALKDPVQSPPVSYEQMQPKGYGVGRGLSKADIDRLEQLMQMGKEGSASQDPEISQLDGMLEKVLDIQYPERVQEKLRNAPVLQKEKTYSVSTDQKPQAVSLLSANPNEKSVAGFYGLEESAGAPLPENAITAVVHETQELVSGALIKLRLTRPISLEGNIIPKDNFVFGVVTLNGERLSIEIKDIRYSNALYPVHLAVYDLDGVEGIHIPGAIDRDVAKQSASTSIGGLGLNSISPSLEAQAASAGIEAAKSLISKKVKLIKVTVKAGYQVLLWDKGRKQ